LRLPARPIPPGAGPREIAACLFDEDINQRYFRKVAERCYRPATRKFIDLVEAGNFKLTIGFSMSFIEQARYWDLELLELFRRLVAHPNVELAAVEPYHSFLLLWDLPRFVQRMQQARQELGELFGKTPQVADTTELMMSDTIYHALNQAGFKGAFFDGRPWVLDWRQPTYLYGHNHDPLHLLARHYQLSDDVGYRFSNRSWGGWPLKADTYADWLAAAQGDLLLLGWDYETFGEHHNQESGIFEFLDRFVKAVPERGLQFRTASEVIDRHADETYDLPLPALHSTWAGNGGLDFFLGNPAQQSVFQLMLSAYNKALLTDNPELIDLALWLAQSDNLHLIQWYGRQGGEAEVSAYFTPREWWQLGPERIILEIQKVYHNFIYTLDRSMDNLSLLTPERQKIFTIPVQNPRL
jgi:alpha-amylase